MNLQGFLEFGYRGWTMYIGKKVSQMRYMVAFAASSIYNRVEAGFCQKNSCVESGFSW